VKKHVLPGKYKYLVYTSRIIPIYLLVVQISVVNSWYI